MDDQNVTQRASDEEIVSGMEDNQCIIVQLNMVLP